GKAYVTLAKKIGAQLLGKIRQGPAIRFLLGSKRGQGIEIVAEIGEVLARERRQSLPQMRLLDQDPGGIEKRAAFELSPGGRERPERRRNHAGRGQLLVDPKSRRTLALGEDRKIVVGNSKDFAQHADYFVGVPRIGHDCAKRG